MHLDASSIEDLFNEDKGEQEDQFLGVFDFRARNVK